MRLRAFVAATALAIGGVGHLCAQPSISYFDFPSGGITGSTATFVSIKFPKGISIAVPRAWRVLGKDELQIIETTTGAVMDLTGIDADFSDELLLVAANSMPRTTYATMRLTLEKPLMDPKEIRQLFAFVGQSSRTSPELRKMAGDFRAVHSSLLKAINQQIIGELELRVDRFGRRPALVTQYQRTGLKGPVAVQINYILGAETDANLTLSYRETEGVLWKPVLGRIRHSLQVQ